MLNFFSKFADNIVSHFGRFFWLIQLFGVVLILMGLTYLIMFIWIEYGEKVKTRSDIKEDDEDV